MVTIDQAERLGDSEAPKGPLTHAEIAKLLRVSPTRVKQIEAVALRKLRQAVAGEW